MITGDRLKELLSYNPETGDFTWIAAPSIRKPQFVGTKAGASVGEGYWRIQIDGCSYLAHRLAWFYVYGQWPDHHLDHINCSRSDNRIANLRKATQAQNLWNMLPRPNKLKGAYRVVQKSGAIAWRSMITRNGERTDLGVFPTAEDANAAYAIEAQKLSGEFVRF